MQYHLLALNTPIENVQLIFYITEFLKLKKHIESMSDYHRMCGSFQNMVVTKFSGKILNLVAFFPC